MRTEFLVNGLPDKLRLDCWWFSDDLTVAQGGGGCADRMPKAKTARPVMLGISIFMVLLADWLFWQQSVGISIAVFFVVMNVAMLLTQPMRLTRKKWGVVIVIALMANLPVAIHLQPLSILFSGFGFLAVAVWLSIDRFWGLYHSIRVVLKIILTGPISLFKALQIRVETIPVKSGMLRYLPSIILPLSFGLVFVWLFISANPFLERMVEAFTDIDLITPETLARLLFWCLVLILVWPYLNLHLFHVAPEKSPISGICLTIPRLKLVVNKASVRNSLFLFNAIFALQTGLDLLVLSGGMALPNDISYASYAHRGAYPLVATALLSGAFAIGTKALLVTDKLMRGLVYLWLFQNLFLVLSAAFRLKLYVETYALTYLRVAAFFWMALVFAGLVLVFIQIARNRDNSWLILRNCIALIVVLYVSCFANFPHIIASFNVTHSQSSTRVDKDYICILGPQALPVILSREAALGQPFCPRHLMPVYQPADGWRDWGFRNWRLGRYLRAEFPYQVSYGQTNSNR